MTACHAIHISKNKEFVLLLYASETVFCLHIEKGLKERGVVLDQQSENLNNKNHSRTSA